MLSTGFASTTYFIRTNRYPAGVGHEKSALFFYYDRTDVKHQYERLIYDVPQLVSALGGSLGLAMGMSFLTSLCSLVDFVEDWMAKKCKRGKISASTRM